MNSCTAFGKREQNQEGMHAEASAPERTRVAAGYLELTAGEPEQQVAVNAMVQKAAPVLAQPNLFYPVAHLCHRPAADVIAHLCLDTLVQPLLSGRALQGKQVPQTASMLRQASAALSQPVPVHVVKVSKQNIAAALLMHNPRHAWSLYCPDVKCAWQEGVSLMHHAARAWQAV